MLETITFSLLPILVAAIVHVILSALWFNAPFLFAKPWLEAIGKTAEQVADEFSPRKILYALVTSLLFTAALSVVLQWSGITRTLPAALLGAASGLLLASTQSSVRAVFEGRPPNLILIYAGHDLVTGAAAAAVLALWI